MLISLSVKNFILIDVIHLDFKKGLSILTGETGAGKSIILDALGLVLGKRANVKCIKDNKSNAVISAEFDITNLPNINNYLYEKGFDPSNHLLLKRVLEPSGKTKCYINDIISNVATMEFIGEQLVEISNQHDQKGLFNVAKHRTILDEFANISNKLKTLSDHYHNWKQLHEQLIETREAISKAEDEKNYLTHIIQELSELNPQKGEEEHLTSLRSKLRDKAKIQEVGHFILEEANNNGIIAKLHHILKLLSKNSEIFNQAENHFESGLIEIQEGVNCVEKIYESFVSEEFDLNKIEERLFNIKNVARKYGVASNDLDRLLKDTQDKLMQIGNYDKIYKDLEQKYQKYKAQYIESAQEISDLRKQNAKSLEMTVKNELSQLKMGNADFKVIIEKTDEMYEHGMDRIRFLARTNPNSLYGEINKIASGGELSRIFLSLRVALAKYKSSPTIIFDEIDIGVGGSVADSIGKKLSFLSQQHQLIVITHQPQVAAYSDNHYFVEKNVTNMASKVMINLLNDQQKIYEIARMLSGENITEESISAAQILVGKANKHL